MTDYEEQKMIEQAQAGDPKAKFEMSQWALERSEAEPGEERWKRLAAKCLVEAAQAGYEPAQQMVQQLMAGGVAAPTEAPVAEPAPQPAMPEGPLSVSEPLDWQQETENDAPTVTFRPVTEPAEEPLGFAVPPASGYTVPGQRSAAAPEEKETPFFMDLEEAEGLPEAESEEPAPESFGEKLLGGLQKAGAVLAALFAGLAAKLKKDEKQDEAEAPVPADAGTEERPMSRQERRAQESRGGSALERWVGDNWKVLGPTCIAVIAVMAILIVLMLVIPVKEPAPETLPTPMPTPTMMPTPTPEPFPSEAVRTEINTDAGLSYRPGNEEFLSSIQNFIVDSDDGMNMRSGPSTDYDVLLRLGAEQGVAAYASHKSGEETWYLINADGDWGWVIADYLLQR